MNKPPAFQFYVDDFLGGTMHFTDAEVGLYIRLLCIQWSTGKLPDDNRELSSYGKGDTPVERVKLKFKPDKEGFIRNERMEIERRKQEDYRRSCSEAGKKGGGNPNFKKGQQNPYYSHKPPISIPLCGKDKGSINSPSPSPISYKDNGGNRPQFEPVKSVVGSVFNLTKILEAKQKLANDLKNRHCNEGPLSTTWSDKGAMEQHSKLRSEIKQLNQQLASMA